MSSPSSAINNNNFIADLSQISNKQLIAALTWGNDGSGNTLFQQEAGGVTQFNAGINAFLTNKTYPRTFDGLLQALRAQNPSPSNTPTLSSPVFTSALAAYENLVGFSETAPYGQWSDLTSVINASGGGLAFIQTNFKQALDSFAAGLTFDSIAGTGNTIDRFMSYLSKYFAKITEIDPSAPGSTLASPFASYLTLYNAFVPNPSPADFQARLSNFYNQMVSQQGYFLPSQFLETWVNALARNVSFVVPVTSNTGAEKTAIILQILELIQNMINTIQDMSTAQAQRLQFYANWQQAYTNLISKVPVLTDTAVTKEVKSKDSASIQQALTGLNATNQGYTSTLQGFRDAVSSETQAHQSAVNQSKEALNSQTSLATSLLQELTSLLQTIFSR